MKLQVEDRLILSCIKINPTPNELEQINELIPFVTDWDYLISTIIDRGIGPLLFKKLLLLTNSSQIPEPIKTKLQQVYYKTFSRSTILYEHFRKIAEAFAAQNIPVIALKGIYLSEWLYQDIGLRQFSDIDLLVKKEDAASCLTILEGLGYKPLVYESDLPEFLFSQILFSHFKTDIVHYTPMVLYGVSIELHIKLHRKTEQYQVIIPALWDNALPATVNGVLLKALNTNDLLIHLCLHLDKHFRGYGVQFTCFNDITNLLEKNSETINWNGFIETCRLYNCEEVVFTYIVMVNKFMNAAVPLYIVHKYSTLLTEKDKQLFIKYLKGYVGVASIMTLSGHFGYLKNVQSISGKVRYIREVLFPSMDFMVQTYQIKRPGLVLFYYPYRYYIGIMGVVNYLKKKAVGKK